MKHLLARLGMVAWWLGALVVGMGLIAFVSAIASGGRDAGAVFGLVPLWLVLWAISFVLGGSFWRPPRANQKP